MLKKLTFLLINSLQFLSLAGKTTEQSIDKYCFLYFKHLVVFNLLKNFFGNSVGAQEMKKKTYQHFGYKHK